MTSAVYVPHIVREQADDQARPGPAQEPSDSSDMSTAARASNRSPVSGKLLPDDIAIRVAGRGTESLPRAEGIDVVGAVDGPDEDAFFESIRAVVVPYGKRHWYDETYPASGVVAHAMAYRTPVVCTDYGSLAELDEKTGAIVVRPNAAEPEAIAAELTAAISSLVNDRARLTELGEYSENTAGPLGCTHRRGVRAVVGMLAGRRAQLTWSLSHLDGTEQVSAEPPPLIRDVARKVAAAPT